MRGLLTMLWLVCCTASPLALAEPPDHDRAEPIHLDRRYQAILKNIEVFGEGGREVLGVAYRALREGQKDGRWDLVGLEDLWAEAIKEGAVLFNKPDRRWGLTKAAGGPDNFTQSTVGPWQMTLNNIVNVYGEEYGIDPDWTNWRAYEYCRENPEILASMAADYLQESYSRYGRRGPYAIQRYYALNTFVRGQIGQGPWDRSVSAAPPGVDPALVSPEAKANTGFYAKQVLLGTRANPRGLLYWLWVSGDMDGIREVLQTWRDQRRLRWDEETNKPVLTDAPGGFAIRQEDLKYLAIVPACQRQIAALIEPPVEPPPTDDISEARAGDSP